MKIGIFFGVLWAFAHCVSAEAASFRNDIKEGNRYYRNGEYTASREKYANALEKAPESDVVNFNLGTAYYKEKNYEQAVDHFQKVFLSDDDELKENAHYNLGNVLYRLGMTQEDDSIEHAISSLENALSQYQRALSIDKNDKDAQYNYDYVQKELVRLKEKHQQQQNQQCDLPKDKKDQEQQDQPSQEEQKSQQQQQEQSSQEEQKGQQQQQGQDEKEAQQQKQEQQTQSGSDDQKQEEQSGQEGQQKEQQEKPDQGHGQAGQEDYNKQQEAVAAQAQDTRELTQKEAQMLLESYQQAEEPQGLLNVYPMIKETSPVIKDW
ncbi:MAG: tetratricopeptide repeat protein [Candidatus Omnitrophica bacterium]|nr:tetratricopeptide repeat protein [Candidatus Omnitrophota bacterium]